MNYSLFEKKIAKILFHYPRLKSIIKIIYQKINFLIYKKSYSFQSDFTIKKINIEGKESFFGYYGISPLNKSNEYLLFHSSAHSTSDFPDKNKPIEVVLYDFKNETVIKKFNTSSYNWQQGAKLNWIDWKHFIFNDYDQGQDKYISKIVNAESGKINSIIDYPIYDTHSKYALSINYDRLNILSPDYGYRNKIKRTNVSDLKNDGIFLVDLEKNTSKLIVSIKSIIDLYYKDSMEEAKHWINHTTFSPNGNKILFLHRWITKGKKYDSLKLYDISKKSIECIADDGMISHFCWIDNRKIVVYMRDSILGVNYFHINLERKEKKLLEEVLLTKFGDGHPSFNKEWMIFDSYPNKSRMKDLMLYSISSNKLKRIGEFFENFNYYGETRCDLHPRWSDDGKVIFIDSVHEGKRYLYKIGMKEI